MAWHYQVLRTVTKNWSARYFIRLSDDALLRYDPRRLLRFLCQKKMTISRKQFLSTEAERMAAGAFPKPALKRARSAPTPHFEATKVMQPSGIAVPVIDEAVAVRPAISYIIKSSGRQSVVEARQRKHAPSERGSKEELRKLTNGLWSDFHQY